MICSRHTSTLQSQNKMLLLCNPLKVLCQSMLLHQGCITRCTQHGSNKPDKSKASPQSNNATCNIQLTLPRPQSLRKVFAPSFPTADHSTKQSCSKPMNSITSTHQIRSFNPSNHAHDLFQTHSNTTVSSQTRGTKCRSRRDFEPSFSLAGN